MKNNFKKSALVTLVLFVLVSVSTVAVAQNKKMEWNNDKTASSVVMTWNKNTPESEMNDDIKALKEHGVTIKYSNVKRNAVNEITGIKVSFSDDLGNKGELNLDYKKPINTISFYKKEDEIGFGNPENSNQFGMSNLGGNELFKQFQFKNADPNSESFGFAMPENGGVFGKSKIIIKDPNKKELIIEDGKVIEGGDDYTAEELEKIKNSHKVETSPLQGVFDLRDDEGMKNFKNQFQKLLPKSESVDELNAAKDELTKAKDELVKAREELQKANENLTKNAQKKSK